MKTAVAITWEKAHFWWYPKRRESTCTSEFFSSSLEEYNNLSSTLHRMIDSMDYVRIVEQMWKWMENTILDTLPNYNMNALPDCSWPPGNGHPVPDHHRNAKNKSVCLVYINRIRTNWRASSGLNYILYLWKSYANQQRIWEVL